MTRKRSPEGIEVYLPARKPRLLVQARIDADLVNTTRAIMKERGYNWNQLLEACLTNFVKEFKVRRYQRCPVCKYNKTYQGPICPTCTEMGYRMGEEGFVTRRNPI